MSSKGKGKAKGKEIADYSAKRKRENEKSGGRKRTNRAVLQFFEDAADEGSDYDTSEFEDDFGDDDDEEFKEKGVPGKSHQLPAIPKEEELSGDELERQLEERYRSGSGYVRYAEDVYESKRVDKNFMPSATNPVIWKVKCKIGRERHSIFCLMQKYVDLKSLGNKLLTVSAFSVEHVRGFIFVEANKQFEVMEACKQLPDVYYSLITHVPSSEFSQLLAVRRKQTEVSKGMWVRVKSGNYKGDLAQVVAVGDSRKKATVKLIPRVDFQSLAAKFGGGSSTKRSAIPKPRLITSSDLEEFRPLIQYRRDRDTGMQFEVLDSLMLKDGYLYKKVSVDSLRFCDVNPSVEELQKFRTSNEDDSGNIEFLSQLYGDKKEKLPLKLVQGGGKGEGTSGSKEQDSIEVHDLVLFGKREFGMVIGMEKDEIYKILKNGSEGSTILSLAKKDLKNLNPEKKFTALDHRMKTIFFNDVVKLLAGPLKDKEGVVKQIYRGIIFLYDQSDMEDNAYFCEKSQLCEKVKHNDNICLGKDGISNDGAGPSGCEDLPSSPRTPLSPEKPWQTEEQNRSFNQREQQEGAFSVGQSLRIRVGPLKGYLCRVLAVRRSDVTVKLDSRQKVLTVKSEHLSEVRGKSFATSTCDETGLDSSKPFDFLGNHEGGSDWMAGSVNADRNEEGQSNGGSTWPAFTSAASSVPWGASTGDTSVTTAAEDAGWQKKPSTTLEGGSSWGQELVIAEGDSSWGQQVVKADSTSAAQNNASSSWDKGKTVTGTTSSWGNVSAVKDQESSWNSGQNANLSGSWNEKGSDASAVQWTSEPPGSAAWSQQKPCANSNQASENAWDQSNNSQDKVTNSPVKDSWGKAVDTWGNNGRSSGANDWTTPAPPSDSQNNASWSRLEGQNATGGCKEISNEDRTGVDGDSWAKPKSSSRGASWTGSKQEGGWSSGKGSAERSSEPAGGWSGGSSGWGQQKSSGTADGNSTLDKAIEESQGADAGGGWGTAVDSWAKKSGSSATKEWGSLSDAPEAKGGGWGNSSRTSWSEPTETDGQGGGRGEFRGRGGFRGRGDFGGRRGRGYRGGRDEGGGGRGRGRSFEDRQSWNNEDQDKPSWGNSPGGWGSDKGGGGGWGSSGGRGRGNDEVVKDAGGGWGSSSGGGGWGSSGGSDQGNDRVRSDSGSGWGSSSGGGWGRSAGSDQGSDKVKSDGGGGWNSSSGGGGWGSTGGSDWGNNKAGNDGGGGGWGSSGGSDRGNNKAGNEGGGGWGGSSGGGWGSSGGDNVGNNKAGNDSGGGWGSSSGTTGGGCSSWGNATAGKNDDQSGGSGWGNLSGGGGSSWVKDGSKGGGGWGGGAKADEGGGGRGGRGGYRGRDHGGRGRGDQGGRGRGRGRQSWNNNEAQDKPTWGSSSGGWGGDRGNDKVGSGAGGYSSSGGATGGGGSWGKEMDGNAGSGAGGWGSSSGGGGGGSSWG